jgi:hypothetical protein
VHARRPAVVGRLFSYRDAVPPLSIGRASWLIRALIGTVVAVGVVLMAGLSASPAMGPVSSMDGMTQMSAPTAAFDVVLPADDVPGETAPAMGCEGSCDSGLLHACLAVLALVAASVVAAHIVHRLIRGRLSVGLVDKSARWVEWGPPPWSVLSLSQLSVLRV